MFGFPTGKLPFMAEGALQYAIDRNARVATDTIEVTALRFVELDSILDAMRVADLSKFKHVSFHAPACVRVGDECSVVDTIAEKLPPDVPIIQHPDTLHYFSYWRQFGNRLLIENMDLRKRDGITVEQMADVFKALPEAQWCFDVGHARQVDPTMKLAGDLLTAFHDRLAEIHISRVEPWGQHAIISVEAMQDYRRLFSQRLHKTVPVVIEVPLQEETMNECLQFARLSVVTKQRLAS